MDRSLFTLFNQRSGKVNFTTDTLETHDLINTATNDQRSVGGNLSGGRGENGANDALFQAGNDFNVNGVAQNERTRSTNKSSSTAIGGFADTRGSAGIIASKGKGYAKNHSFLIRPPA